MNWHKSRSAGCLEFSSVAVHPLVILDFEKQQVVKVIPGNPEHERMLAAIREMQRNIVMTASGCQPPPPQRPR